MPRAAEGRTFGILKSGVIKIVYMYTNPHIIVPLPTPPPFQVLLI